MWIHVNVEFSQIHLPELVGLGWFLDSMNFQQQNAPFVFVFFEKSYHLGNLCSKTTKVGTTYFFAGYKSILFNTYSIL